MYETIFNLDLSSFSCTFGLLSVYKTLMYSLFASLLFCVTKRETVGLELFLHYALRECVEHNSTPLIWICRTRRTVFNRSHEAEASVMCSKLSCICWFGLPCECLQNLIRYLIFHLSKKYPVTIWEIKVFSLTEMCHFFPCLFWRKYRIGFFMLITVGIFVPLKCTVDLCSLAPLKCQFTGQGGEEWKREWLRWRMQSVCWYTRVTSS